MTFSSPLLSQVRSIRRVAIAGPDSVTFYDARRGYNLAPMKIRTIVVRRMTA